MKAENAVWNVLVQLFYRCQAGLFRPDPLEELSSSLFIAATFTFSWTAKSEVIAQELEETWRKTNIKSESTQSAQT